MIGKKTRNFAYKMSLTNYSIEDQYDFGHRIRLPNFHFIMGYEEEDNGFIRRLIMCYYFKHAMTFDDVQKYFPKCHIEVISKSYSSEVDYCKKENDFFEKGDLDLAILHDRMIFFED